MDYDKKLQEQKDQFKTGEDIRRLPDIFDYWSDKYLRPKLEDIFGVSTVAGFYSTRFLDQCLMSKGRPLRFVSIGSGDCLQEIEITRSILASGYKNFEFIGLEVSEALIRESQERIAQSGLESHLRVSRFDLNRDHFDFRADGVMANHSLHHIVELEELFATIEKNLSEDGCFLSMDMIGRNGHMRWPETLRFVEAIWSIIDESKKYHHQLNEQHTRFVNFDCSLEGFEGIRSQDIMPLLIRLFSFKTFFAVGGLVEVFVDRGYGPNYSIQNPSDLKFVDFLESLNAQLIELGFIKPTMLFADMRKRGKVSSACLYKGQTPEFCTRIPA